MITETTTEKVLGTIQNFCQEAIPGSWHDGMSIDTRFDIAPLDELDELDIVEMVMEVEDALGREILYEFESLPTGFKYLGDIVACVMKTSEILADLPMLAFTQTRVMEGDDFSRWLKKNHLIPQARQFTKAVKDAIDEFDLIDYVNAQKARAAYALSQTAAPTTPPKGKKMKTKETTYVIRGLDMAVASFRNSMGDLASQPTFKEITVHSKEAALTTLLSDEILRSMSPTAITAEFDDDEHLESIDAVKALQGQASSSTSGVDAQQNLAIVDIKFVLAHIDSKLVEKEDREELNRVTQLWAEKSRVNGARGFRVSAVKNPRLEKDEAITDAFGNAVYCLKTTVILGNSAIYSKKDGFVTQAVNLQNDVDLVKQDLQSLSRAIADHVPGLKMTSITARHSIVGDTSV
jgi:acyl carrier protein